MKRTLIVWGAGRIGRGFVSDIFQDDAWRIVFVDVDRALVDALNERGAYTIFKATSEGMIEKRIEGGFTAIHTSDAPALNALFEEDGLLLDIAVHAPKLREVADMVCPLLAHRAQAYGKPMDVMMNVNMTRPDEAFTRLVRERLDGCALSYFEDRVGVTGIAAMCISPLANAEMKKKDPLALLNNGYHEQAIDKGRLKCEPPRLPRLRLCEDVAREETRKLFTLNLLHAAACYLGLPRGLVTSYDAATNPETRALLETALLESSFGLIREFGFGEAEMAAWRETVMKLLLNPYIRDDLQRLGADTRRKLGGSDRLVGPAKLCVRYGGRPEALAEAIRAGFDYENDDEGTQYVRALVREKGLREAVKTVCGFSEGDALLDMILQTND